MNKEKSVSTRLWLEKHVNQTDDKQPGAIFYTSKKATFDAPLLKKINQYIKEENVSWETLLSAGFGLLLSRLSSSSIVHYSVGISDNQTPKNLSILGELCELHEEVKLQTTVGKYLEYVSRHLSKKHVAQSEGVEIRYLLLFKSQNKPANEKTNKIVANKFPLVILADADKTSQITVLYSAAHFSTEAINSILTHLEVLFKSICEADSTDKVYQLNMLTADERTKILSDWRTLDTYKDIHLPANCMHDLFASQAKQNPHNLAIQHNGEASTYRELYNASTFIADKLVKQGVQPGDKVCVLMDRTASLLAAMLAIFRCGATFIPINPKYPDERVSYVLTDSNPTVIIVNNINKLPQAYHDRIQVVPRNLEFDDNLATPALPSVDPESIAYIVYTSGTTGNPKGVMIQHRSLINFSKWYELCFGISTKDRASQFASQGFDSFFCETVPFLTVGASIHIVDDNIKLTPPLFFEWLKSSKITVLDTTTAYAQILFCLSWPADMSLRVMKVGGEALTHYPHQAFTFDIWNTYGPTEATIETTYVKIYEANNSSAFDTNKAAPPIGKPLINSEVYIVDQFFQPVPPGVVGELLIGGANVSSGYLNRAELTEQRFISININGKMTDKLYRTGDLVRWLDDGNIDFIGRIDHQVKIRGYRVEPGEIEHAISLHSDVKEAVVIAQDGRNKDKSLIAYVVPDLNKERFLYQQRCLISITKDNFFESISDDISKEGISVSGLPDDLSVGTDVKVHIKLPGMSESRIFSAVIVWINGGRCGMRYMLNDAEKDIAAKSIDSYLQTHNVMDMVLSSAAKRSLKKALKKKMPEYMIPTTFVSLLEFPLNYNGKIDVKSLPPPQSVDDLFREKYVPPTSDTEKKLSAIWCALLEKNDISMSDNFFDAGGTSITAAKLSIAILKEFDITIPVRLLFDLSYVPVLSEYIETRGMKYTDTTAIQEDVVRDGHLDNKLHPTSNISKNLKCPEHILLTGAGGFLGIYMLRSLLQLTNAKIYCLVRKSNFESAAQRLNSTIQSFELQNDISLENKRIVVIPSDLSHDNFGLAKEHYDSLLGKIDLIYHCGAQVNIMASYGKLRGSNVKGTNEVIKFATKVKDKPIHYISTLSSAYCKDETGALSETFPTETYEHLFGGYAISKWVSERLLTQINDRGLPVVIYRSGYIFGQSDTGITSLNDALLMLIKGCIQLGYAPEMHEKITLLPVDYVSRAIISISLAKGDQSDVFHIDHPTGIMWSDLVSWLNEYGYKIKKIPMTEWQHLLETIEPDNTLFPFLPYYLSLKADYKSDEVNVSKASKLLTELSLPYPPIDDALLNIYIDYLCQVGFLPVPEKVT